ncbi:MAG TPA: type II secretion system F family protein [Actinomycetota bacterium]|nr:type II secretion system F family protein [Actinomycetota bacterium]
MSEILLALLSGVTVLLAAAAFRRTDPVVAGRVAALTGRPAASRSFNPVTAVPALLGRSYPGSGAPATRALLDAAGMGRVSVETVRGLQLILSGLGFVGGLAFGAIALVISPVGTLVGYRIPRSVLTFRSRKRKQEMAAALPDVVDLLAVCSHAGLNISLSLKRVVQRAPGPLGKEIQRALEEIELGVPRAQALQNLASRNGVPELESLVRLLLNSERFGTRITASLETFSADVRGRLKRSAEEQARKAPVKILFPLVFLILPAFILLTVVPLLVSAFQSMDL